MKKWIAIIVASIAGSFSTSAYTSYYINNTDKIGVQPVALVDQITNGSDCMVKETANQEVITAFANIFEGNN